MQREGRTDFFQLLLHDLHQLAGSVGDRMVRSIVLQAVGVQQLRIFHKLVFVLVLVRLDILEKRGN